MRNETEMTVTTDAETLVRRAYRAAEGNVMDVQGFIDLFADDGVFNAVGQETAAVCPQPQMFHSAPAQRHAGDADRDVDSSLALHA